MEYFISDVATEFFTSTLGIILTTVLLISALVPGVKFLSRKFDERTDKRIDAKLQPIVQAICSQVSEITKTLDTHQAATNAAIEGMNRATTFLQDLMTGKKHDD